MATGQKKIGSIKIDGWMQLTFKNWQDLKLTKSIVVTWGKTSPQNFNLQISTPLLTCKNKANVLKLL